MTDTIQQIISGLHTGFIDKSIFSEDYYLPRLLVNNPARKEKVLSSIIQELETCDEFFFSVAFITNSGVATLANTLRNLERKGVRGKIIVSQYQNFTEPRALQRLIKFKNLDVKIISEDVFHAKGYIFKHGESYTLIVGSSNLTANALCSNKEWNLRVTSTHNGSLIAETLDDFNGLYKIATPVDDSWIAEYDKIYEARYQILNPTKSQLENISEPSVTPNKMQAKALASLEKLRSEGKDKALLISATGTGKTYLSAFDVLKVNPKRFLFIVHRENITKAAMRTFKKVFGDSKNMGVLTGNEKQFDADYIFSTVQTVSQDQILERFSPDYFDYIVIDETHRAGAKTYQKIFSHFRPAFFLGMTATPERTDGFDIFKTFDYNIAYEIRLNTALEEKMLTPFHYYGVTDITLDGEEVGDESDIDFNLLTSDERVNKIIEYATFYGCDKGRVKGLIFCRRVKEAEELSRKLNERGFKTEDLSGEDNEKARELAISKLESDDPEDYLDYILTTEIFNEGIDIPSVNQIIMLRPTNSAIIFVQQLGRGLRKTESKDYLTVIDFIGNYENNYLIPIALSGNRSYDKETLRRYLFEGGVEIPGSSTIHFDEISKDKIFKSIDSAKFRDSALIKRNYDNLKMKLGRIPSLSDFDEYGEMDVLNVFYNKTYGSYYNFLVKYETEYSVRLSEDEEEFVKFVSQKLAKGLRVHELELLRCLLNGEIKVIDVWKKSLQEKYKITVNDICLRNVINIMTQVFPSGSAKDTYGSCVFLEKSGESYEISKHFSKLLENKEFFGIIDELVEFGISRYQERYSSRYQDTDLVLYQRYSYEDVCRLLCWEQNGNPRNIGGYQCDENTKTFPVFINYNKEDNISETTKYEDRFLSPRRLIAISKSGRKISSRDVQNFLNAKELGISVHLFVRKNKDDKEESKEFYYLGRMLATGEAKEFQMLNTTKTAVEIEWLLDRPVDDDIYNYITKA